VRANNNLMRNALSLLALFVTVAVFTSGCAGPEEKLGRGVRNTVEVVRLGEMRASVEQTTVWGGSASGVTTGVVKGVDNSLKRTLLGVCEIVTFPFPPYHPIFTKYIPANPVYPDNYKPGLPDDPFYHTDTYIGFSGGDVASFVPGSRFRVFDTQ
jgi:putative exosortase-associated protein (TIGR04073 family)